MDDLGALGVCDVGGFREAYGLIRSRIMFDLRCLLTSGSIRQLVHPSGHYSLQEAIFELEDRLTPMIRKRIVWVRFRMISS